MQKNPRVGFPTPRTDPGAPGEVTPVSVTLKTDYVYHGVIQPAGLAFEVNDGDADYFEKMNWVGMPEEEIPPAPSPAPPPPPENVIDNTLPPAPPTRR